MAEWGATALELAAGHGHEFVVRLLLEHKARVNPVSGNESRSIALREAVNYSLRMLPYRGRVHDLHGHDGVVRALLEHGADPTQKLKMDSLPCFWPLKIAILPDQAFAGL